MLSLAPAAAAVGAGAGASLAPLSLFARAGGMMFQAASAASQARHMREQEKIQAEWGRIRADQTDTAAREGLESDLASYRAAFNANDAGANVNTLGILNEVRQIRNRDRRIQVGNRMRESRDAEARMRQHRPGLAMFGGMMQAMPTLFQAFGSLR